MLEIALGIIIAIVVIKVFTAVCACMDGGNLPDPKAKDCSCFRCQRRNKS